MPYMSFRMEFEWDTVKSDRTYAARGFDFAYAVKVFLDPRRIERRDDRRDYGEERRQVIGVIEGRLFFVAYTLRGRGIRIISARRAHENEERAYHAHQTGE